MPDAAGTYAPGPWQKLMAAIDVRVGMSAQFQNRDPTEDFVFCPAAEWLAGGPDSPQKRSLCAGCLRCVERGMVGRFCWDLHGLPFARVPAITALNRMERALLSPLGLFCNLVLLLPRTGARSGQQQGAASVSRPHASVWGQHGLQGVVVISVLEAPRVTTVLPNLDAATAYIQYEGQGPKYAVSPARMHAALQAMRAAGHPLFVAARWTPALLDPQPPQRAAGRAPPAATAPPRAAAPRRTARTPASKRRRSPSPPPASVQVAEVVADDAAASGEGTIQDDAGERAVG
jgi:hypothetical protein